MIANIVRTHIDGSQSIYARLDVRSMAEAERYMTDVLQYEIGDKDKIAIQQTLAKNPHIERKLVRYHIELVPHGKLIGVC